MKKISSSQNPRLKAAIRLKSSRGRKTQQRIIVFGYRELHRAIGSGIQPLEVFLSSDLLTPDELVALRAELAPHAEVYDLPATLMARLKYGDRCDGVVGIAQRPDLRLDRLKMHDTGGPPLVVILESIEKPGNIGAVLRSVDGAGASAVILTDPQCDALHPNCIRASLGSVFSIPVAIAPNEEAIAWCRQRDLTIFSLTDSGQTRYTDVDWCLPIAIVLGSEASGLSKCWFQPPCRTVAIPMQGIADSLNVSVAAGVVLYEAQRQRLRQAADGS